MALTPCFDPNATLDQHACYGNGVCGNATTPANPLGCACEIFYLPLMYCEMSVFALTGTGYTILALFTIIFGSLVAIWSAFEFALDLRFSKFNWKKPSMLAKANLVLFAFCMIALGGIELYNSLHTAEVVGGRAMEIVILLGTVLMNLEFNMVVVQWITILVRAKTLGSNKFVGVRRGLMILMCVMAAICLVCIVLLVVVPAVDAPISTALSFISPVYIVVNVVVCIVYIARLQCWVKRNKTDGIMRRVMRKNSILIALLVILCVGVVNNIIQSIINTDPWVYLIANYILRSFLCAISFLLILFLENYFFTLSPFGAYWLALKGELSDSMVARSAGSSDSTARTSKRGSVMATSTGSAARVGRQTTDTKETVSVTLSAHSASVASAKDGASKDDESEESTSTSSTIVVEIHRKPPQ